MIGRSRPLYALSCRAAALKLWLVGARRRDNELYRGDYKKALGAIKAKAYVMPGTTDLYFPPEDSQFEVAHMPNASFVPITSIWGHFAGGPGASPADDKFLDGKPKELLPS
jgi:homoserine O-acetyltransferase